jgi:hypothetical protein
MFVRPHLDGKKLGMVAHVCHPSYSRKCKIGGLLSRMEWARSTEFKTPALPENKDQKG